MSWSSVLPMGRGLEEREGGRSDTEGGGGGGGVAETKCLGKEMVQTFPIYEL